MFKEFNLQHHESCESDYLKIIDGDGTTILEEVCGSELPSITLSRTEIVHIIFHSDGSGMKPTKFIQYFSVGKEAGGTAGTTFANTTLNTTILQSWRLEWETVGAG